MLFRSSGEGRRRTRSARGEGISSSSSTQPSPSPPSSVSSTVFTSLVENSSKPTLPPDHVYAHRSTFPSPFPLPQTLPTTSLTSFLPPTPSHTSGVDLASFAPPHTLGVLVFAAAPQMEGVVVVPPAPQMVVVGFELGGGADEVA